MYFFLSILVLTGPCHHQERTARWVPERLELACWVCQRPESLELPEWPVLPGLPAWPEPPHFPESPA